MAQLNFPENPVNGQLYPDPCPPGTTQYRWDSGVGIWRIVGVATDVTPGTYGSELIVGQFTVDVTGRITEAANVNIRYADMTGPGVVQLTDSLGSLNSTLALTATAGKRLQDQIGNLVNCTVPNHTNVVEALNDLQQQSSNLQENAAIWCGYYNALEGDISFVSITGFRLGYRIGQELPTPGPGNGGDFFIVNYAGNPYIAGDFNAPNQFVENGNWIMSEVNAWSEVNARGGKTKAIDVEYTPNNPLTANNVQNAIYQITQLFRTGIGGATVSPTKPENPYPGQLWWDNDDGLFYIYYRDQNGDQWVEASGSAGGIDSSLGAGGGVYEVKTGRGLAGGPIVTTGTVSLKPAFFDARTVTNSEIGGVIPNLGFSYNNTSGLLNLKVSSDPQGTDPYTAFSQEGASIINSKVNFVTGKGVLAGTYDASTETLVSVTPAGGANGFVVGEALPDASQSLNNFYVIVTTAGPEVKAADWLICDSTQWFHIDFQSTLSSADNVDVRPIEGLEFSGTVQTVLEDLQTQVANRVGGLFSQSESLVVNSTQSGLFGSTNTLTLLAADTEKAGVVQLTSNLRGNSESLAVTQLGVSQLNAKVDALSGGPRVLAGTFNCSTGLVASVTPAGQAAGFFVDEPAPTATLVPDNYYLIATVGGGFTPFGADGYTSPGDWFLAEHSDEGNYWVAIRFDALTSAATNVSISPVSNLSATTVQDALAQLQDEVDEVVWNVFVDGDGLTVEKTPLLGGAGSNVSVKLEPASSTSLGGVAVLPNRGLAVSDEGSLAVTPASETSLGGVIIGDGIEVDSVGRISVPPVQFPQIGIQLLDDVSSAFSGRRATFLASIGGNELPRSVQLAQLFIAVDGRDLRPGIDFSWDPLNSLLTFSTAPNPGVTFSGRVLLLS